MAYNLLGQQGPKGDRNPDPNLTAEQATYLYDTPPGQGDNKGLTGTGKPVDEADVKEKLGDVETGEDEVVEEEDETTTPTGGNETIKNIQQGLKDLGFDPGPIDGIIGPQTRGAAQSYIDSLSGVEASTAYKYYEQIIGGLNPPTEQDSNLTPGGRKKFGDNEVTKKTTIEDNDFLSVLNNIEFGPSISADISEEELDKLNRIAGFKTSFRGGMNEVDYKNFMQDSVDDFLKVAKGDTKFLEKVGAGFAALVDIGKISASSAIEFTKDLFGETVEDIVQTGNETYENWGRAFDSIVAGFTGETGTTPVTDAIKNTIPDYKWDSTLNKFYNARTNTILPNTQNDAKNN